MSDEIFQQIVDLIFGKRNGVFLCAAGVCGECRDGAELILRNVEIAEIRGHPDLTVQLGELFSEKFARGGGIGFFAAELSGDIGVFFHTFFLRLL